MTSVEYTNPAGQTVSEVPGQPGRVITGRPDLVVLHNPNLDDPFAAFDEPDDCLTCPEGMPCCCTAYSSDADWDRER